MNPSSWGMQQSTTGMDFDLRPNPESHYIVRLNGIIIYILRLATPPNTLVGTSPFRFLAFLHLRSNHILSHTCATIIRNVALQRDSGTAEPRVDYSRPGKHRRKSSLMRRQQCNLELPGLLQ